MLHQFFYALQYHPKESGSLLIVPNTRQDPLFKQTFVDSWRWDEAYFAQKLLDFDLASNNGGWQWAAGSGCDAAPYFRIFNSRLQTEKFDSQLKYIRKWVPEFEGFNYVQPIVQQEVARKRCLETYPATLKK